MSASQLYSVRLGLTTAKNVRETWKEICTEDSGNKCYTDLGQGMADAGAGALSAWATMANATQLMLCIIHAAGVTPGGRRLHGVSMKI